MLKKEVFEKMFEEWYAQLVYFAYYFVNDREVSRDIVSDAFEHILLNGNNIDVSTVKAYLYKIVRSKCIDYLRKQRVHSEYLNFIGYLSERILDFDVELDSSGDRMRFVKESMKKLTPYNLKVLKMCYINKKSYKEVAGDLGISVAAVHKHIVVSLRILRNEVKNGYGEW